MVKIRDISGFHGSLATLRQEELAATGFSADGQAVIRDLERMFKSLPPGAIEGLSKRRAQRLADRATKPAPRFAKACRDLDQMVKAIPAVTAKVAGIKVSAPEPSQDEIAMKAISALQYDPTLNAAERGSLMIALGTRVGAVFAKSEAPHPMAAKIDRVKEMLTRVHKNKHAERAAPIIEEALQHIKKGVVSSEDFNRLTVLLNSVKEALAAGDSDAE